MNCNPRIEGFRSQLLIIVFSFLSVPLFSQFFQVDDRYSVVQDLTALENDAIPVQIITPLIQDSVALFQMPKVIPGTYKVHNYGLFIRDFLALTATNDTLAVERKGINSWQISNASSLYKIEYQVEDSFDSEDGKHIFSPSGSSLRPDVFLLNQFAFIGYLEGYKDLDFEVHIKHPKSMYGAGAWPGLRTDTLDQFEYPDYFDLHDNPMLYCKPDTVSTLVGGAIVELSIYSPNGKVRADSTMLAVKEVLEASAKYLGGNLPVDKYSILVYCETDVQGQLSYGALEHHRSTVLYMPEMEGDLLRQSIRDIVAHEFLHIITPLGIHSEYVHNFNFADPEMSRHLWLYEGVTEYNSHLVQVQDGIYSPEGFLEVMRNKFLGNEQYEDIPLTAASRYTLDIYPENFLNFYEGGAIAAMALDLYLIELSKGEMKLSDLLQKLAAIFPADTFFEDEHLFEIIAENSYPEVETFMVNHFEAGLPFPWERLFQNVGIDYLETGATLGWSLGSSEFSYDLSQSRFIIAGEAGIDEFGKDLGLRVLDQIISINGDSLTIYNFYEVLDAFQSSLKLGDEVEMVIARPKKKGGFKIKTLKAKARQIEYEETHQIILLENPSEEQRALRKSWLGS